MKTKLFLVLLLAVTALTSFENTTGNSRGKKLPPVKKFCGPFIKIVNNSSHEISSIMVFDDYGNRKFPGVVVLPGQSHILSQWPGPGNNFTVKMIFSGHFDGSLSVVEGSNHLACVYFDNPAGYQCTVSFSSSNCGIYDVRAKEAVCW